MNQIPSLAFQQSLYIGVPAAQVWHSLVTPEQVALYYLCPLQTLELHPGGRIEYGAGSKVFITGTVKEIEPEQRLIHTFRFNSQTHQNVEGDPESRVCYLLVPMGEMCKLTLKHDDFGSDNQTCLNVSEGWPMILSALKTLLETGKRLPWPASGDGPR